ncbi:MAG: hypothetical protein CMD26_04355 [Flavobacteriales bacterium]|nr:hypothetical protein [Flavobacteriales bacterium]|tara:strand:+ start:278 stop:625 length:348 start_codon:yes stop_codon:yes gene_type:complete
MDKADILDHLTAQKSSLVVISVLNVLGNLECSRMADWPFEDLSLSEFVLQVQKIYSNIDLKNDLIQCCVNEIKNKNSYLIIEGGFRLLKLLESLERYEDCIILKDIKDSVLLDVG